MAQNCNYKDTLDDMLRDRLVCGINQEATQRRLLAEPKLTLTKALELAQGMETAGRNVQEILAKPGAESTMFRIGQTSITSTAGREEVHIVSRQRQPHGNGCFRCGNSDHVAPVLFLRRPVSSVWESGPHQESLPQQEASEGLRKNSIQGKSRRWTGSPAQASGNSPGAGGD